MSRIAYFKGLNQTGLDESQSALIQSIQGQYTTLSSDVSAKASAQSVTDLTSIVSGKASTSALSTLNDQVLLKASSGVVSTLQDLVDTKASVASVTAVNDAVNLRASQAMVTNLSTIVDGKVGQSVYDARVANEAVFFGSVKASIHLVDAGNVELNYVALGLVPA